MGASRDDTLTGLLGCAVKARTVFSGRAGPDGVTLQVLVALHLHPGQTVAELSRDLNLAQPNISRAVGELRERVLIRHEPDEVDRRRLRLYLTGAGEDAIAEFRAEAEERLSRLRSRE